jgi:hypothetical protein
MTQEGAECAVGFFAFPRGYPLRLVTEDDDVLFDEEVTAWAHLQGKCAPWETIFVGSALERAFRQVWTELRVIENDWV